MSFSYDDEIVNRVEDRIKETIYKKRKRLLEFFDQFDELRKGHVSRHQFERCLGMLGFNFSEEEFQQLANKYSLDKTRVDYREFSDAMTHWIKNNTITRKPSEDIVDDSLSYTQKLKRKEVQRENDFHSLWEKLKREMRVRGLRNIETFFQDFDKHNNGKITKDQFFRALPFELSEREEKLLEERYEENGMDVNYVQFSKDLEQDKASTHTQSKHIDAMPNTGALESVSHFTETKTVPKELALSASFFQEPKTAEEVEHNIKKLVYRNRIRISEGFKDYDPLRSRKITENQFASGLGSIKFPHYSITENEINLLIDKYKVESSDGPLKVKYQDFINEIDSVFTKDFLEKRPKDEYSQPSYLSKDNLKSLKNDDEQKLNQILDDLRYKIRVRGVLIKPFFHDFDRTTKGVYATEHITRTRFERALSLMNLDLSPNSITLICDKYDDKDDGGVNYVKFLKDVDPLYSGAEFSFSTMKPPRNPPSKPTD
eukprot:gb/GECH01013589.1/.p1 GENE.gb/GECH01013589.1/~~gb/GECH01013589.1/.p1  ORF type:complete len:486 (+),score=126.47 gb/GECH01013589.1/:1-1458(+)